MNWLICVNLGLWSCQLFGTNVLHGCWLFWQNEILILTLTSFISKFVSSYVPPSPEINCDGGHVNCCTNVLHGCWLFWQNKILDIFHFNINLLSPDFKYSRSTSEWYGFLVMLNALTTSFVGAHSFDKSSIFLSSHFSFQCFILPCLHILLLTCSPLLAFLISTQLLCHLLSHLLGLLESS